MLRGNASRHTAIDKPFFRCPNCDATYHVVKAEIGPESTNSEIMCRTCGGRSLGAMATSSLNISRFGRPAVTGEGIEYP